MVYVREPAVSGTFYPANPGVLRKEIEEYLKKAHFTPPEGKIVGVISPHAGYVYSGHVAAYGFKAVMNGTYDTVIIIAPSHRAHFDRVAVLDKGAYKTPLGTVEIDEEVVAAMLRQSSLMGVSTQVHRGEHSLEVQVPFLQVSLNAFKLVPLIMGSQTTQICETLSTIITEVASRSAKRFLIVGSTDLSHYHPYQSAVELDKVVIKHLEAFDAGGMMQDMEKDRLEACGAGPIIATMMASRSLGATKSRVLKYANSGDVPEGDKSGVVGYVSSVFYEGTTE
jgi:MEMO1 family protein